MASPTSRALELLRKEGYVCAIAEHWNAFAKIRQDLFGFIDIVALMPNRIVAVQVTDSTSRSKHRTKIRSLETARAWNMAGGQILLLTFYKRILTGKKRPTVTATKEWLYLFNGEWVSTEES